MISIDELRSSIEGRTLPGGDIAVEAHESIIGDEALRADDSPDGVAHPAWFVIASLRGMGISVNELCALAQQAEGDTLLFGSCEVTQNAALVPGTSYTTTARIGKVDTRTIRDGSRLDSVEVVVDVLNGGATAGTVASVYLFKRAA